MDQVACKIPFFMFCGYSKKEDVGDKIQKITALGGCCEYTKIFSTKCSHVICKKPAPSEIFLAACLTGKWILMPKYIQDCFERHCWLEEQAYEWESRFTTDCLSSLELKLYNAPKQHRLLVTEHEYKMFKGWKVIVLIDDNAKSRKYSRLLKLGKADIVNPCEIREPSVVTTLTHIFFEGLNFEPLFLIGGRIPVLRPEYIDSCIVEVKLPNNWLFEINLSATSASTFVCPINERICNAGSASDFCTTHSVGNTTLAVADSVNTGTEKMETASSEEVRRMSTKDTQFSQSDPQNIQLPFITCGNMESAPDVPCHLNKRFKPDKNAVMMSTPKEKYICGDDVVTESLYSTPPTEAAFSETELDTYEIPETVPFEGMERRCPRNEFSGLLNSEIENKNLSPISTKAYENHTSSEESCSLLDDIMPPREHLSTNNNTNIDSIMFTKTLKHENKTVKTKRMLRDKFQSVITSYFVDPKKECSAEPTLNTERCSDIENGKISSLHQNSSKKSDTSVDLNIPCSSNGCLEILNQIDVKEGENIKTKVFRKYTMKNKIDNHQRYCNITSSLKIDESSNSNSVENRPLCGFDELLDVALEEDDVWNVLSTAESLICPSYQPHPHILNSLMFRFLECSFDENISSKSFIILHRIFHLHRPGNNKLGQYYLDAFSLCGKEEVSPWFVLARIIRKCVQHKSSTGNSQAPEYLLSFIVDVIVYNFMDFKYRSKIPRKSLLEKKGLFPIAAKIFWPTNSKCSGSMNKECKELFHYIYELLDCSIKPKHMFGILLSLQKLVGVIAECSILFDPGTQHNVYNRSNAHSVATALVSAVQAPLTNSNDLLDMFLDTMQCVWLRLLFCQKFLDHCTNAPNNISTDDGCLTLEKIMKDYMQRTPPKFNYRLRNHSSKIKKPKQPPDKIVKCNDSRHQRSSSCHYDINKCNAKGETKLHIACKAGKDDDVRKLLDVKGIDVNIQDNAGWTPLHEACAEGHIKCVQLLLEWSSSDNGNENVKLMAQSAAEGITPLHDAVQFDRVEIADLLLKHGGRRLLERCSKLGYTPSDFVRSKAMEQLLTSAQQYPHKILKEEQEVIEISSDSDAEEDHVLGTNIYQYLFLVYHMLISYLTVYRIDEMMEELKKIVKQEDGISQFENKSYANASPRSYNMQVISKAVSKVLNSSRTKYTPELEVRNNDLCLALNMTDTINDLLLRMSKISLDSNAKAICTALECLSLKYKL